MDTSAFIATNPEALLPQSIASTPPLGANLLTPNSLRRGAGHGGPELGSLDCQHVFESAASNGGAQDPSSFDGGSNIEIPVINDLVLKADVRSHRPWHLHTCDDDLDLGRAAVDEEFDAVDET